MKKLLVCLLALALCAGLALAETGATFALRFDEGFRLSLPEGWVRYPPEGEGVRYILGDGAGRWMYILAEPSDLAGFDALREAVDAHAGWGRSSLLDLNGQPFAAFIAPELNASACATLLNGETLTFLFTPQDDPDFMLTAAEIMASYGE